MTPPRIGNRNATKRVQTDEIAPWFLWEETDRAERAIRWIETYCTIPAGYGAGQKMKLAEFQREFLRACFVSDVNQAVLSVARGNGKSSLIAGLALWALFDSDPLLGTPQVPIISTRVQQAYRTVYKVCLDMLRLEPELSTRSLTYSAIGAMKITTPYNGGELFLLSSDVDGLQGLNPTLAICDEIGFIDPQSWDSLLMASMKRPTALVIGIGTPGLERENALWRIRKTITEGGSIDGVVYQEYAADHGYPVDDSEQLRKANPLLVAGLMNEKAILANLRTTPETQFRIFHLGQWVDGVESWLGADGRAVWQMLKQPYQFIPKHPTWIGIDVGLKRDSTAVCTVQYRDDGRLHAKVKIWVPTNEEAVDITDVMQYIRNECERYKVGAVSFDNRFFDVPAKMLHDEGLPMVEVPQSVERMTGIIGNLYELIMRGDITHDDDELFETQVLNAIPRYSERGFTLQKSKSRGRIDAAIALALAVERAQHKAKPKPPLVIL